MMADITQEAIRVAAKRLAHFVDGTERDPYPEPDAEDILWATGMLEAAAPLLAAAVGRAILAQKVPCPDHPMPFPKPSCWTCARNGAFHRAALIAASFGSPFAGAILDRQEGTGQ